MATTEKTMWFRVGNFILFALYLTCAVLFFNDGGWWILLGAAFCVAGWTKFDKVFDLEWNSGER